MKAAILAPILALCAAAPAHALEYDLRDFVQSNWDYVTPQTDGALWTAHYGNQDGGLLPPLSAAAYGYACGTCTQIGQLINAGDAAFDASPGFASAGLPSFDGVFLHPGPGPASSVAIVFTAQSDTWLDGVTVQAEMVVNGLYGDGVDIAVSHTRNGLTTVLGSYGVSGPDRSEQMFSFGPTPLLFSAGDRIEIDVGANGGYTYDHLNINAMTRAVSAPVPEPLSATLMLAGLGLVGLLARHRGKCHA